MALFACAVTVKHATTICLLSDVACAERIYAGVIAELVRFALVVRYALVEHLQWIIKQ